MRFYDKYNIVQTVADFPAPSAGVITLPDNTAWLVVGQVDIGANRIVCQNAALFGNSVSTSAITNSNAGALITTTGNFRARSMTLHNIGAGTIFDANGTGVVGNSAFVLREVAMDQGDRLGTVRNYVIVFIEQCAMSSLLGGLTIDNTVGSVTIADCALQSSTASVTILNFPATFSTTGRIRVKWCQIVTSASVTGINVSASATLGIECYIVNNCSFSTTGTPIAGVQPTDNKSFFKFNRNVGNSSVYGQYYMQNNATATTIAVINTFVKIAGTTTVDLSERFTHASNRFTYNGMQTQTFLVFGIAAITSNSGNEVSIGIAKNGTVVTASQNTVTAQGAGQYVQVSSQVYVTLATNDFIEVFAANTSATNNITARFLSVAINAVG